VKALWQKGERGVGVLKGDRRRLTKRGGADNIITGFRFGPAGPPIKQLNPVREGSHGCEGDKGRKLLKRVQSCDFHKSGVEKFSRGKGVSCRGKYGQKLS